MIGKIFYSKLLDPTNFGADLKEEKETDMNGEMKNEETDKACDSPESNAWVHANCEEKDERLRTAVKRLKEEVRYLEKKVMDKLELIENHIHTKPGDKMVIPYERMIRHGFGERTASEKLPTGKEYF